MYYDEVSDSTESILNSINKKKNVFELHRYGFILRETFLCGGAFTIMSPLTKCSVGKNADVKLVDSEE
jgi:hypothetical protein